MPTPMAKRFNTDFYFVIVNYYSTPLIRALMGSIEALTDPGDYRVLVVNNSPGDTAVNPLASDYQRLSVIEAQANLGFGHGCNLALRQVFQTNPRAVVWLINPDAVLRSNALTYVRACLQADPEIAILGTGIVDVHGQTWFRRGTFNPWLGYIGHTQIAPEMQAHDVRTAMLSVSSRWVSGCSLILNLVNFSDCPRFDPQFFLYYEDNELCERAFQSGLKIRVTLEDLVIHDVSAIVRKDLGNKYKNTTFGRLLFLQKHGKLTGFWLNLALIIVLSVIFLPTQPAVSWGRLRGVFQFLSRAVTGGVSKSRVKP
ncbi:MAG: glycosyltransferase family 2 protein [Cyanobacteria bacterium P01_D01_bin.44]